jgi:hypothetical protein
MRPDEAPAADSFIAPLSISQRCYTDALHSIFKFLTLNEMVPVLQACTAWLHAVRKEKSRAVTFQLSKHLMSMVLHSALLHHIRAVTNHEEWTASDLCLLEGLQLTDLNLALDAANWNETATTLAESVGQRSPAAAASIAARMQISVTYLTLGFQWGKPSLVGCQLIVDASCSLPNIVELCFDFKLLPTESCKQVDFKPLLSLSQLIRLAVGVQFLSASTLNVLSLLSLKTLQFLENTEVSASQLKQLASNQLAESLEVMVFKFTHLSSVHLRAMFGFRSLHTLVPKSYLLESVPLLSGLIQLQHLHFQMEDDNPLTPASVLVPHFLSCQKLVRLRLYSVAFSASDLEALLGGGLKFVVLIFFECELPTSLSAFSKCPSLTELQIKSCSTLRLLHLASLRPVASLRTLHVDLLSYEIELAEELLMPELLQLTSVEIGPLDPEEYYFVSDDED